MYNREYSITGGIAHLLSGARNPGTMVAFPYQRLAQVALSFVAVNTVTVLVVASHLWWARSSGYQKYADIVSLMKERRTSAAGGFISRFNHHQTWKLIKLKNGGLTGFKHQHNHIEK